ncbi:MAG: NFACT family protein [Clostridia bacterium]|nr:NFACT family protein [Clostridia bacterium]
MPQDAFHIRRIARELDALLKGGKVNRVSQADKDEVTLIIYTGKETVKLVLSTNASFARVCLSQTEREPAPIAPNFCMLLRKHLLGAELLGVKQHEFERIIELSFHCVSDFSECERVLRAEIMGKYSNLVLTENDVILGALKTTALIDDARRILFAGAKYVYPAPQDKLSVCEAETLDTRFEDFCAFRTEKPNAEEEGKFLFENVSGLALPTATELAKRRQKTTDSIGVFVRDFCLTAPVEPCVLYGNDGTEKDFFAFPVANGKPMPSLLKAADVYYSARENRRAFTEKRTRLEAVVRQLKKKQEKRLKETLDRLQAAEGAEENRIKGELLTANLYRIQKGATECTLENWYSPDGESVKITLDPTLSPAANAQRYFKLYNKQKRTKEALAPRLDAEKAEIAYAESIAAAIRAAENLEDLKETEAELIGLGLMRPPKEKLGAKKKDPAAPFREYLIEGFRVLSGRNNLQNDRLLKAAAENDLWLHTQKYHSSHVIVIAGGKSVPESVIKFAAEVCAYYSDGREGDKIPVDYCLKKHVKKPPRSPAGFVVYTDYKTALATPNSHREWAIEQ